MLFRRKKLVCQRTVICDQKEAFCIFIQASHRKKSLSSVFLFNIVENRFISGVLRCADTARRLVKKIVYIFRCSMDLLPVHNHLIFFCYFQFRFLHRFPVNLHLTLLYVFFYLASCTCAGICQKFIQPDWFFH